MNTKIKICGLNSIKEVETVHKNGAFWYGLVFYEPSPRNISLEKAKYLVYNSPSDIKPVAVTVDSDYEEFNEIANIGIKTVQLHGNEDSSFCKYLKNSFDFEIIKALNIARASDVLLAKKYVDFVDWILFDYKSIALPGGSGKSFNWEIHRSSKLNYKWILSGGLDHNNVLSALEITKANAVDVSSGVEDKKGKKSKRLISSFCQKVVSNNEFKNVK